MLFDSAPSASPGGVAAELISQNSVVISWHELPDDQQNGVILGYSVSCTSQEGYNQSQTGIGRNVSFTGLVLDSYYTCTVCAYTSVGCGPAAVTYISTFENCMY